MGRRTKLTPELQAEIVDYIRSGCFDYVAAEASGIDQGSFYRWMARGEKEDDGPFCEFREAVVRARAAARAEAEKRVWSADPKFYLKSGPGRERPGRPGWTDSHHVEIAGEVEVKKHFELTDDPRVIKAGLDFVTAMMESHASGT